MRWCETKGLSVQAFSRGALHVLHEKLILRKNYSLIFFFILNIFFLQFILFFIFPFAPKLLFIFQIFLFHSHFQYNNFQTQLTREKLILIGSNSDQRTSFHMQRRIQHHPHVIMIFLFFFIIQSSISRLLRRFGSIDKWLNPDHPISLFSLLFFHDPTNRITHQSNSKPKQP